MATNYTTKTASLKATTADIRKLNINGEPFSKVVTDYAPETRKDNDIWKYAVTTDDNGVVTITDDVAIDYVEIDAQKNILKSAAIVEDNKVYSDEEKNTLLMNWDTKNFTNINDSDMVSIFNNSYKIKTWDSDLSSLTNGSHMFYKTTLASFNGDLSSLENGYGMFTYTRLTSFDEDLSKLTNGGFMFANSALKSFSNDLSSLTNGDNMFSAATALTSFSGDLSSLTNGTFMFDQTALESFSGDLPSLENGYRMFGYTDFTSFDEDLPSLTNGNQMFINSALISFNGDLSNLVNGKSMFANSALKTFNGDLSSLTNGDNMFYKTALASFSGDLSNLVNGQKMFSDIKSNGLKSFISDLSSLKCGFSMFGNAPLDEESIMLIADTINYIKDLDDWTYTTYNTDGNLTTETISSAYRKILHLGYDSSIEDTTNINAYCDEIAAKGWTVYLNGTPQTANNGAIEKSSLTDENGSPIVIPHYYKPVQVTDEEIAEYIDQNGNYYIIVGAQHVFGDDISTYGMFTSHQHAVSEITTALGLTPYVKPAEESEI